MTKADLTTLLRSMPAVAMEAVKEAKIAGPRLGPPHRSFRRTIADGEVGYIVDEGRGYMFWCDGPRQPRAEKGETFAQFAARIDTALRADGWVFTDHEKTA